MLFVRLVFSAILAAIFGWCLVVLSVLLFAQIDEATDADVVIVLGAAQYDGRPSPVLKARLDHAIGLIDEGYSSHLILTGGVGVGDTVSEAEVGRRYVMREGVPAGNILIEGSGLSSEESMLAVLRLMEGHQMSSAILVSDPFHMLRLRLLAARLRIRAYSSPTRSSPIADGSTEEWRHVVRESVILPSLLLGELVRF
jgi:uncharacterized SAM-binding protein YcdF (DUF218 family)